MPITEIEHQFDKNDQVVFAHNDKLKHGKIIAMKLRVDWSHDSANPNGASLEERYVVQQQDAPSRTFTKRARNIYKKWDSSSSS